MVFLHLVSRPLWMRSTASWIWAWLRGKKPWICQEQEIKRLHLLLEDKNNLILQLNDKVADCQQNAEGNRQLINKLLNDIERLQQDVEWYKRTYEKRSLAGVIKDRLKYLFNRE